MIFKAEHHRLIYFIGLALVTVALPTSKFALSIGIFTLLGNWLTEGNFKEKLQRLWSQKSILLPGALFVFLVFGLLFTEDYEYGLKDLRIKLPLLALPIIIGSSQPPKPQEFRNLLWLFVATVVTAAMINGTMTFMDRQLEYPTGKTSFLISHIRFALLICVALISLVHLRETSSKKSLKQLAVGLAVMLTLYLLVLGSMTGLVVLLLTGFAAMIYFIRKSKSRKVRLTLLSLCIFFPALTIGYLTYHILDFYDLEPLDPTKLETHTENGHRYGHYLQNPQVENGHYVWTYLAYTEMQQTWPTRSDIPFFGKDSLDQPLYSTLIRFLTSKGLRKDANGIKQLTDEEVRAIEHGMANVRFMEGKTISNRIYQIIWEFDNYRNGMNPEGNSVTQRLEFWKAGWSIFLAHPILGVGTGDVNQAYLDYYTEHHSILDKEYWLRAHNQYLTFLVTLGIPGFLLFMALMLAPFFTGRTSDFLNYSLMIIFLLSMINEDTLETQIGLTWFAFFYSLFLFGREIPQAVSETTSK